MKKIGLGMLVMLTTSLVDMYAATDIIIAENEHAVVRINEKKLIEEAQRFIDPHLVSNKVISCSQIIVFKYVKPNDCIAAEMTIESRDKDNIVKRDIQWFWFNIDGTIVKNSEFRILDGSIISAGPIVHGTREANPGTKP